jgi:8-oxo-dGTP diphosphatase
MDKSIHEVYGNRIRLRACGICIENGQLLLVNHQGLVEGAFWAPPGGGVQLNETAADCVAREFLEETGLIVEVCDFLFATEFIKEPLHAVELFFSVKRIDGEVAKGSDPETMENQAIQEVRYMKWTEIDSIDERNLHGIFKIMEKAEKIVHLRGYFKL